MINPFQTDIEGVVSYCFVMAPYRDILSF